MLACCGVFRYTPSLDFPRRPGLSSPGPSKSKARGLHLMSQFQRFGGGKTKVLKTSGKGVEYVDYKVVGAGGGLLPLPYRTRMTHCHYHHYYHHRRRHRHWRYRARRPDPARRLPTDMRYSRS